MKVLTLNAMLLLLWAGSLSGCALANLAGGMAQNFEYEKKVRVPPEYTGLEHEWVAVVVNANQMLYYEFPLVPDTIAVAVSGRIAGNVEGVSVVHPDTVKDWQYRTPQWEALPYGDIVKGLNVDRVVFIDLHEYRLHPPGNRWEWEGRAVANISIIERDGFDPDQFSDTFRIQAQFPRVTGVTRDSANTRAIYDGLMQEFVQHTAWLFFTHEEYKYPGKHKGADA